MDDAENNNKHESFASAQSMINVMELVWDKMIQMHDNEHWPIVDDVDEEEDIPDLMDDLAPWAWDDVDVTLPADAA